MLVCMNAKQQSFVLIPQGIRIINHNPTTPANLSEAAFRVDAYVIALKHAVNIFRLI